MYFGAQVIDCCVLMLLTPLVVLVHGFKISLEIILTTRGDDHFKMAIKMAVCFV